MTDDRLNPTAAGDPIARVDRAIRELIEIRAELVRDGWPDRRPAAANDDDPDDDMVRLKAAALWAACADMGLMVTGDGFVAEADAAALIGKSTPTLRRWRGETTPIPFRTNGHRIEYALDALAIYLVAAENS